MQCMFDTGTVGPANSNGCVIWTIEKFYSLRLIVGCEIRSPEFAFGDSRYTLELWPRGHKGYGTEEWFGICLYKYDAPGSSDSVEFSIASGLGNIRPCTVECSENNIFMQEKFMEWSDFRALSDKIVPNGCLTILCRLTMENPEETNRQNGNSREEYSRLPHEPPFKLYSGDYQCSDPLSTSSSFRIIFPDMQASGFPGLNYGSPSTINSFYSSSSVEKSFGDIPESAETKDSNFAVPFAVEGVEPGNTLWNSFTRGFFRATKAKKSDAVPDNIGDIPEKSTPEFVQDSLIIPNAANFSKNAINSNVNVSKSAARTNISKSVKASPSSSPQTLHSEATNVEETKSEKTAESEPLPISSFSQQSVDGFVANSAVNSTPKSNQRGGPLSGSPSYLKGLKVLSQHFKNLYLEGKDFDLKIIMEGKEFKVLRGVLKERSPVFKQLLSEDTGKNTSNIITIDPFGACDSSVFHGFLLYIYSSQIENLTHKHIYGLYCAACKFEVPELKEECVEILKTSLSVETITDIIRFINNETELEEVALVFLARNLKIIMNSDEWKRFMREDPDRAVVYQFKALDIGYVKTIV